MKKKTITLVIYMLVCISLVSVGFAAWIITGGDKTEASGNIVATTVNDESLVIRDAAWVDSNSIAFGRPESGYNTGWLQAEAGDAVEKKNASYSFTLALSDQESASTIGAAVAKLDSSKVKITFTHSSAIQDAIEDNYIKGLKVEYSIEYGQQQKEIGEAAISAETTTIDSDFLASLKKVNAKTATITIKISYEWGTEFGGVNPYEYYNRASQTGNDKIGNTDVTYKADAKENLQGLYEALYSQEAQTAIQAYSLIVQIGVALQ